MIRSIFWCSILFLCPSILIGQSEQQDWKSNYYYSSLTCIDFVQAFYPDLDAEAADKICSERILGFKLAAIRRQYDLGIKAEVETFLCDTISPASFAQHLEINYQLSEKEALQDLLHLKSYLQSIVHSLEESMPDELLDLNLLRQKHQLLTVHIDRIIRKNYLMYNDPDSNYPKWMKSINLYHDNDFLSLVGPNLDKDYTGGFKFEWTTDYLKLRFLNSRLVSKQILSYQSVLFGGEGYSPYVRFDIDEFRADSLLNNTQEDDTFISPLDLPGVKNEMRKNQMKSDRPFASFQYVARAKYRMHVQGIFRGRSIIKVGRVGGEIGRNIQAIIHQDLITNSQQVLNWEDQIASGGRYAFNVDHSFDFMLLSKRNTLFDRSENREANFYYIPKWLNIYMPLDISYGTVYTYQEFGIGFTNKHFIFQNQNYGFRQEKGSYPFLLNIDYRIRHVTHNGFLEGIGLFAPFEDDILDTEPVNKYVLSAENVAKWLHSTNLSFSVQSRKVTLFYQQSILLSPEYIFPEDQRHDDSNFNSRKIFGYGRLGFNATL